MLQIMKKNILPLLMAVVALCSCSDEDLGGFSGIKTGEVIDFGVSAVKTRANYTDGIDSKQVRWESDDVVRIYYVYTKTDGTVEITNADYTVIPEDDEKIGEHKELGSLVAKDENNQLKWAEGSDHRFYAVYPADDEITIDENGVATFPINRNQKCSIRDPKQPAESAYTKVAEPDDKNIYMVASATAGPQSGSVWLDFKPIMTTINVVVKGPQNLVNGEPDENTDPGKVIVTGVSFISTITTNTDASKSKFNYDIAEGKITGSATGTGTATKQTETTFISVVNPDDGLNAIEMEKGHTLVLTGFLPPMEVKTAAALEREVQIRVHTTGGNKTMPLTKNEVTALLPSAKGAIKLPSLYTPITGSNWITPLDDDIYVAQLSIPGTHDAATVYCTDALLSLSESGQCQQYTIEQQLEMGIRVFDIRPSGDDLAIYHGLYACYNGVNSKTPYNLSDIYGFFNDFLDNNPNEFIIVLLRWEEERIFNNKENKFNSAMSDFVTGQVYLEKALPREILDKELQNLTVGDMRGKILSIMRPNQGTNPDGYFQEKAPAGMMFISGFPGSHPEGSQQAYLKNQYVDYGTDQWGMKTEWIVYCQNYYEVSQIKEGGILGIGGTVIKTEQQAVADKLKSVKTYIEHATTQANDGSNIWVLNHCSGYRGSNAIFSAYSELAENLNPDIYSYINDRTTPGCLGMILLDFVGTRTFNGHYVYGDLLPQTIIDNNYKYRMKRKGDNSK